MEVVLAVSACLMTAVASFSLAFALTGPRASPQGARARTAHLIEMTVERFELVGHGVALIRLANRPAVAARLDRLAGLLRYLGIGLTRYGCLAGAGASLAVAAVVGLAVSGSAMGSAVCCAGLAAGAALAVSRRETSMRLHAEGQMPEVLRSFSTALGSGKSLAQAVEYVGRNTPEPLGAEFLRASFEITGGRPVDKALEDLCGRVDVAGMNLLGTALLISQRTGSPLDDLFTRTARMVSGNVALKRELGVKTSQARLSAKVVAGMPAILVGVLTLISPDYREGLATPMGGACLAAAAMLDAFALASIRSLMRTGSR